MRKNWNGAEQKRVTDTPTIRMSLSGEKRIFYTDLIPRGDCYVFAFTLKSMYGVKTEAGGTPEPWEFPYEIGSKVAGQIYYGGKGLQRSEGTEVYKEIPRAAAYLDHTVLAGSSTGSKDQAVWNYVVYDPDDAMEDAVSESNRPAVYAGNSDEILKQMANDYLGSYRATSLLNYQKSESRKYGSDYANDTDLKKIVENEFGLNRGVKNEKLHTFTVTVEDGTARLNDFSETEPYSIYIAAKCFDGVHTVKEAEYLTNRKEANGDLDSETYFAVPTVTHRFDTLKDENMENLKVAVAVPGGSDNIRLTISGSTILTSHLVGFYYELYEGTEDQKNRIHCGFQPYVNDGDTLLPFGELPVDSDAILRLKAVYDTGQAGLNREKLNSEIHDVSTIYQSGAGDLELSNEFYAIQKQGDSSYAASENYDTKRINLTASVAAGSLYKLSADQSNNTNNADYNSYKNYWRVFNATRYPNRNTVAVMEYMYGSEGGYTVDAEKPLFKALAESEVSLVKGTDNVEIKDGGAVVKVPTVKPNIDFKSYSSAGFHSTDISVRFTKKSVETLLSNTSGYKPEVYFELYEYDENTGVTRQLKNTQNRYFNVTKNQEEGFANLNSDSVDGYDENAYLRPTDSTVLDYKIAVRNMDKDKTYYFKMFCLKDNDEKVYIVDNSSQTTMGTDVNIYIRTAEYLNVGSSSVVGSEPFAAQFVQDNYESRDLKVTYSLDRIRDFYIQYQITNEAGTEVAGITPDTMMSYMGYTREDAVFWYYDNEWKRRTYPRYYREGSNGKEYYTNRSTVKIENPEKFSFIGTNDTLQGNYRLQFKAYDLYSENDQVEYRQDSAALGKGAIAPSVPFTVPERKAPEVDIRVTYQKDTANASSAAMTLVVKDTGYCMGVLNSGKAEMGVYRAKLYKIVGNTETEIPFGQSGVTVTPNLISGCFTKDKAYAINYPVGQNERYRVVISGINTLLDRDKEQILYDSEDYPSVKASLVVSDLERPQMNNPVQEFDRGTGNFSISVQNGSNLELINRVSFTLYNMSKVPATVVNETVAVSFGAKDDAGWQEMTLSLNQALEELKEQGLESRNLMVLTVQYQNGDKYLGESTFQFQYR